MVATKRKKLDERGQLLEHQLDHTVGVMDIQDDLIASLPDSLTIDVSLPATVHDTPEDELAVAIVEVPVNPGVVIKVGPEVFRVQEEMAGPKLFLFKEGRIKVV